ncbi:WXG100-like domain-containing protein, partial [Saccharopolyspora elongata]
MDIEFDPSLDGLWILLVGQKAPRVDVSAVRALAEDWRESAVTLEGMGHSLGSLGVVAERSIGGGAGRAFRNRVDELVAAALQLVGLAGQLSGALVDLALDVELTVYAMLIEIISFSLSIAWALASPFTAPLVPSIFTSFRIAASRILGKLHWSLRLLNDAVMEGVQEVMQGAVAQIIQIIEGNRREWDKQSTLIEFVAGGAAGGVMGGMHMGMRKWMPRVEDSALFHGFTEAAAETVVGAGAAGILGGSMDDLWTGAVGGAFTGMVDKGVSSAGEKIDDLVNGAGVVNGPGIPTIDMPDVPVVPVSDKPGLGDPDSGYDTDTGGQFGDTGGGSGDADSGYGSDTDSAPAGSGVSAHGPASISPLTTTAAVAAAGAGMGVGAGGVLGQGGGPNPAPAAAGTPPPGTPLPTPGAMNSATDTAVSDTPPTADAPAAGVANPVAGVPTPGASSPTVDGPPAVDTPAPAVDVPTAGQHPVTSAVPVGNTESDVPRTAPHTGIPHTELPETGVPQAGPTAAVTGVPQAGSASGGSASGGSASTGTPSLTRPQGSPAAVPGMPPTMAVGSPVPDTATTHAGRNSTDQFQDTGPAVAHEAPRPGELDTGVTQPAALLRWPEEPDSDLLAHVQSAMRKIRRHGTEPDKNPTVTAQDAHHAYAQWRHTRNTDPKWTHRSVPRNVPSLAEEVAWIEAHPHNGQHRPPVPGLPGGAPAPTNPTTSTPSGSQAHTSNQNSNAPTTQTTQDESLTVPAEVENQIIQWRPLPENEGPQTLKDFLDTLPLGNGQHLPLTRDVGNHLDPVTQNLVWQWAQGLHRQMSAIGVERLSGRLISERSVSKLWLPMSLSVEVPAEIQNEIIQWRPGNKDEGGPQTLKEFLDTLDLGNGQQQLALTTDSRHRLKDEVTQKLVERWAQGLHGQESASGVVTLSGGLVKDPRTVSRWWRPVSLSVEVPAEVQTSGEVVGDGGSLLLPGLVSHAAGVAQAGLPDAVREGDFLVLDVDKTKLHDLDRRRVVEYGRQLGEVIAGLVAGLGPEVELPDIRITVRTNVKGNRRPNPPLGSLPGALQPTVKERTQSCIRGFLDQGMKQRPSRGEGENGADRDGERGVSDELAAVLERLPVTWSWGKPKRKRGEHPSFPLVPRFDIWSDGGLSGRTAEDYRNARWLTVGFLRGNAHRLSAADEQRLLWRLEGFVGRFVASPPDARPTLNVAIGKNSQGREEWGGQLRDRALKEVYEGLRPRYGLPSFAELREHVLISSQPEARNELRLIETSAPAPAGSRPGTGGHADTGMSTWSPQDTHTTGGPASGHAGMGEGDVAGGGVLLPVEQDEQVVGGAAPWGVDALIGRSVPGVVGAQPSEETDGGSLFAGSTPSGLIGSDAGSDGLPEPDVDDTDEAQPGVSRSGSRLGIGDHADTGVHEDTGQGAAAAVVESGATTDTGPGTRAQRKRRASSGSDQQPLEPPAKRVRPDSATAAGEAGEVNPVATAGRLEQDGPFPDEVMPEHSAADPNAADFDLTGLDLDLTNEYLTGFDLTNEYPTGFGPTNEYPTGLGLTDFNQTDGNLTGFGLTNEYLTGLGPTYVNPTDFNPTHEDLPHEYQNGVADADLFEAWADLFETWDETAEDASFPAPGWNATRHAVPWSNDHGDQVGVSFPAYPPVAASPDTQVWPLSTRFGDQTGVLSSPGPPINPEPTGWPLVDGSGQQAGAAFPTNTPPPPTEKPLPNETAVAHEAPRPGELDTGVTQPAALLRWPEEPDSDLLAHVQSAMR